MENKVKNIAMLRRLIRENISIIDEGGHGGIPYNPSSIPEVMTVLKAYEASRKSNGANLVDMETLIEDLRDASKKYKHTSAYASDDRYIPLSLDSKANVRIDKYGAIEKAITIIKNAIQTAKTGQFDIDEELIEKQVMDALGAVYTPAGGFDQIFGASIDKADYIAKTKTNVVNISKQKPDVDQKPKPVEKSWIKKAMGKFGLDEELKVTKNKR